MDLFKFFIAILRNFRTVRPLQKKLTNKRPPSLTALTPVSFVATLLMSPPLLSMGRVRVVDTFSVRHSSLTSHLL